MCTKEILKFNSCTLNELVILILKHYSYETKTTAGILWLLRLLLHSTNECKQYGLEY